MERQYRFNCNNCNLFVAYRSAPKQGSSSSLTYLLHDSFSSHPNTHPQDIALFAETFENGIPIETRSLPKPNLSAPETTQTTQTTQTTMKDTSQVVPITQEVRQFLAATGKGEFEIVRCAIHGKFRSLKHMREIHDEEYICKLGHHCISSTKKHKATSEIPFKTG